MRNKIFIKIGSVFVLIIAIYLFLVILIISPRVTNYLVELEENQVKLQLNKVFHIVRSKANQLKDFENLRYANHKQQIKDISNIAYSISNANYELYKDGFYSKQEAIKNSLSMISKINYTDKNYIYVINTKGKVLYHPSKKYINKNFYHGKDASGKEFIPTIIKNTVEQKQSFCTYDWKNEETKKTTTKIAHSIYFEPFDMIITSYVKKQNIDNEVIEQKNRLISKLTELMNNFFIEENGYVFILDKNLDIVIHPDKSFTNENFSLKEVKNIVDLEKMKKDIKNSYENKTPWQYNWNSKNDKEHFTYKKHAWVTYNDYFDWYIISSIYESKLKEKAKEIDSIIINLSIFCLFALLIVAIFFVRKLLKPIEILSSNMDLVKDGNLDIRTVINTKDELGSLAKHFNTMLDVIQNNTKNLEQKIDNRTKELKNKLYYDDLTGLKNTKSLIEEFKNEQMVALTLVDINNFDAINEYYGYAIGNEVLIKVKQKLQEYVNKNSLELYRINADVFAIKDINIINFIKYEQILKQIHEIFIKELMVEGLGVELYVSVCLGTSISQNEPLRSAKIALKKAKQIGYKTMVYNNDIDTKENIKKMMHWKDKIKDAIDNNKVVPFYQGIYDKNRKLIKYEALMRIKEEKDGKTNYLSPGNFFDVAIKTKQYFKLNQIIIQESFENIDKIGKLLSVNISFLDILNLEFMEFIENQIEKLIDEQRRKIVFEILESDFISDHKILDDFIKKYRKKGIKFAIDDFGTGYSNFNHVLSIKPEYIKIDGSLIKNINSDQSSYEMVKSIIDFCKSLKIVVVAEFIHNEAVYKILQELGADEYQGFYLGEPKPLF